MHGLIMKFNQITSKPEMCVKFYEICPEMNVPFFFPGW